METGLSRKRRKKPNIFYEGPGEGSFLIKGKEFDEQRNDEKLRIQNTEKCSGS